MNKIKYLLTYIFFFALNSMCFAQIKDFKKGLSDFNAGFYDLAIKQFMKVKNIDSTQFAELNYKIAESYRLTNRQLASIPYYETSFKKGLNNTEAHFYLGYALKANEEYEKAKIEFEKFIALNSNSKLLNERALQELNNLQLITDLKSKKTDIVFTNLADLNTSGSEFGLISADGNWVYSTSKKDKIYANGLPYLGIYKRKVNADLSETGKEEVFSPKIFEDDRNEASATFTPDGKTMIFARGNSGKRKDLSSDVDLYISKLIPHEGWTEPQLVSVSDSSAWDGCPAFSRDGKTLYFGSNRKGGLGGIDLYRVNMDASGRFGNAVNMGKTINSSGDDMFPFVSSEGKLYFSSDGHAGFGKLDLFVAIRKEGKTSVENLGIPFNSSMDDFAMSIDDNGNIFLSSNRAGGKGDDDMYWYKSPTVIDEKLLAKNENKVNTEQKIINYYLNGKIFLKTDDKLVLSDSAVVKMHKLEGDILGEKIDVAVNNGKFGPIKLDEDTDYIFIVEKTTFLTKREGFSMFGRAIPQALLKKPITDTTFNINITLDKIFVGKTFRLENIYYDFDKSDIRSDAAIELDKLVQILNDNPKIKIELDSHTDSQGSDMYNIRLSQRRAESVVKYLNLKGISKERLEAKGYGESELIIQNAKTDAEHQTNRRTEFKIIEIEE